MTNKRTQWIIDTYGERLEAQAKSDDSAPEADAAVLVRTLLAADPTRNKAYGTWLAAAYARAGFLWEDLSKATETLDLFQRWRRRLPAEQRDVGRYATLADLWAAVEPFKDSDAPVSENDAERRERDAVYAETRIIHQDADILIVSPQTERAAKWWGRGTRWCTSAENNNRFESYHKNGDLVVIVAGQRKWQFHAWSNMICNEKDQKRDITWWMAMDGDLLLAHAPALFTAMFPDDERATHYAEACEVYGLKVSRIPFRRLTHDVCAAAVRRNPQQLDHIPSPLFVMPRSLASSTRNTGNEEIVLNPGIMSVLLEMVRCDKANLKRLTSGDRAKDDHLWRMIVKAGLDLDLCRAAVEADASAIALVPDRLLPAFGHAVDTVRDTVAAKIAEQPESIADLEESLQTADLWGAAIAGAKRAEAERDGNPLRRVRIPDSVLARFSEGDWEQVIAAGAFEVGVVTPEAMPAAFPSPVIREGVERALIKSLWIWRDVGVWNDLRSRLRTAERMIDSLKADNVYWTFGSEVLEEHLKALPEASWTSELAERCVRRQPEWLAFVPTRLRTPRLCYRAARHDLSCLRYAPASVLSTAFLTRLVEATAVQMQNDGLIASDRNVPLMAHDARAIADAAARAGTDLPQSAWTALVAADGRLLVRVPPSARSKAVVRSALAAGGLLADAPANLLDEDLCLRTLRAKTSPTDTDWCLATETLANVPKRLRTEAVCLAALARDPKDAWLHVPETLLSDASFVSKTCMLSHDITDRLDGTRITEAGG